MCHLLWNSPYIGIAFGSRVPRSAERKRVQQSAGSPTAFMRWKKQMTLRTPAKNSGYATGPLTVVQLLTYSKCAASCLRICHLSRTSQWQSLMTFCYYLRQVVLWSGVFWQVRWFTFPAFPFSLLKPANGSRGGSAQRDLWWSPRRIRILQFLLHCMLAKCTWLQH